MPEYARAYVEQMDKGREARGEWTKVITYEDVCSIARHQIEEMEAISRQHSAFSIQHSASSIQHSAFSRQHSAISRQHSAISPKDGLTAQRSNSVSGLTAQRSNNEVVFFDTELLVSKIWFEYAFGRVPEWLDEAIKRYPMDVYLLTYPDLPWIPDPARSNGSDEIRLELYHKYEAEIQDLGIPYYIIRHSAD